MESMGKATSTSHPRKRAPVRKSPKPPPARGAPPPGLADALFSRVLQRVLGVLFGNPSRSFSATEIIHLARSGTDAVQRELAQLEASGLVTATKVGKLKHYRANAQSPLFHELLGMSIKTFALADVLRTALKPLASEIVAAFVHGSIATGTDTSSSDIDVLVISDTLASGDVFEALEGASVQLGRRVAPTMYSRKELNDRARSESAFVFQMMSQPKVWLIGDESVLAP